MRQGLDIKRGKRVMASALKRARKNEIKIEFGRNLIDSTAKGEKKIEEKVEWVLVWTDSRKVEGKERSI